MNFKGKRRKTGGRRKGTPNYTTTEVKDKIADLLGQYEPEKMFSDFMELKPSERLKLFASLAEFLAPKQNRTTIEAEEKALPQIQIYLPDNGRQMTS